MVITPHYKHLLRLTALFALISSSLGTAMEMNKEEFNELNRQLRNAITWNDVAAVKSALEQGANPNHRDAWNVPMLISELRANLHTPNPEIIALLLQHGANAEIPESAEGTETPPIHAAIHAAIHASNPAIVATFLSHIDGETKERIIKKRTRSGETILHELTNSFRDNPDVIQIAEMLIDAGADLTQTDEFENTPAQAAAVNDCTQLAAYLAKRESVSSSQGILDRITSYLFGK